MKRPLIALILALTAGSLGGCLVMTGSSIDETGPRVSPTTLNQIEVGETTEKWLIATLGEPTERTAVDDRTDILRYVNTRIEKSGGAVFVLFAGKSTKTATTTTYFEVTDGVVTKHWTEH